MRKMRKRERITRRYGREKTGKNDFIRTVIK